MRLNNFLNEEKSDVKKFRNILNKWFDNKKSKKSKKDIKTLHDITYMINLYSKKGKLKIDPRTNKSGNTVFYIVGRSTPIASSSVNKADEIGLGEIFA